MNAYESGSQKCIPAVLVYLLKNDEVLMLHRNQNPDDIHFGKYNGLGGKWEMGESPVQAAVREVFEESGLQIEEPSFQLSGILYFPSFKPKKGEDWLCYVFRVNVSDVNLQNLKRTSQEGSLVWVPKSQVLELPLWEADRVFIPKVFKSEFFVATIIYKDGKLSELFWHK